MNHHVLTVENLQKTYKKTLMSPAVYALKGVNFHIEAGKITGFLGANGAGKTTTIKCLLGLAFPDSGTISYFGDHMLSAEVKARIGFLPERPYFYEYLTGAEFLRFYAELSQNVSASDMRERINKLLKRVGLEHAKDRPLRGYSKGMLQRVGIAQALVHHPDLVILDEPMTGLDPDGRLEVCQIIEETAKEGTAIFFSSHLLPDAEKLCDNLVILKKGELIYQGSTQALLDKALSGYRIQAFQKGRMHEVLCASLAETQTQVDRLRSEGSEIHQILAERLTLEQAFVKMAFDKEVVL